MKNVLVYLVGPPGVGKFTVGRILADRMPAKLVDNHYWLNPIFGLIDQDGLTPLPKRVWDLVREVRHAVLDTIANLSPRDWNFVATLATTGDAGDAEIANEILRTAGLRRADVLIVGLTCGPEELASRVISPGRRERMKDIDADAARRNALLPAFHLGVDHPSLTIDTTGLTPGDVAERILSMIGQVRPQS